MATNIMKMKIQFRRDTTDNWTLYKGVVPAPGEPCFDLELHTLKIGDGVTTYENLPTIGGVDVAADDKTIVLSDGTFKLYGFDAAEVGAQPRKNASGELEWVVPSTETLEGLQTIVAGLQSDVKTLQDIVTPTDEGAVSLLDRVLAIENAMTGTGEGSVDEKINTAFDDFMTKVSNDGTVNTVKELIDYVAAHGSEVNNIVADITALQELVGNTSVMEQIASATAGKVDAVEGKSLVDDTIITKLEAGTYDNKIEAIKVGDTLLEIVDKTVTIAVGAGLKASDEVTIAEDGTLGIGQINVSKLIQDEESELVLDGGGAAR